MLSGSVLRRTQLSPRKGPAPAQAQGQGGAQQRGRWHHQGSPQAWRARFPDDTQTMLRRLGAQAAVALCVQAAAAWQPPSPLALPASQNQGQVSQWLRPSQAFCPAAAAAQEPELRTRR
ncbi:uncharacterized protein LOC117979290 [Pan paniscus]|uniref:uncharacterized protein LOC117979290 n=1 Tax=Pan paniscus TaxID=9597 RepID=UPI0025464C36|nr:uncharacterized protein LOC117979290 [Pan paniscus]